MTSSEESDFFAAPAPEKIGDDTDHLPVAERLHTARPDRRTQGRILITVYYDIPRDQWESHDTDAVDVLRREVDSIEDLTQWFGHQNNVYFNEGIAGLVTGVDVEAAK